MTEPMYTVNWQDGKTFSECMMYMLEKEMMCDVTFRIGKVQSIIKAHKYMLASRSPVFYTMFEGSCPEEGEVIVPDISLATFKILLNGNIICCKKYGSCSQGKKLQTVKLLEPIKINSNKYFTIIVAGLKFVAYYGKQCKPDYRIDDIIVTFQNSPNCNTTTDVDLGQIAGIEFNV
ncbi:SPOP [Mytilus coruscus]|uniref:SPOP n=1 Tax=Mytilus coruscus TaxID=42192 RepID=A0A6J8D5M2_MYTCO|nr:SPOP [Mytilus coruscus]